MGSIKTARNLARRDKALDMRIAGATWKEIAEKCGYSSQGRASTDVHNELRRREVEEGAKLSELRAVELLRLEKLWEKAYALLDVDTPMVSHGKVIYQEDPDTGERVPVRDVTPVLAAIDRCVRVAERKSKLLGADSPTQVEHTGVVRYEIVGLSAEDIGPVPISNNGHTPVAELPEVAEDAEVIYDGQLEPEHVDG